MSSASVIFKLTGSNALSAFRANRLLTALKGVEAGVTAVSACYVHFVSATRELTQTEKERLNALLDYGDPAAAPKAGLQFLTVPRLGTISPWASKATDIVHNCGIDCVERVERGILYTLEGDFAAGQSRDAHQALL